MLDFIRLNELLQEKGVPKSFIAAKLGKTRSLLNNWQAGKSSPSDADISTIAELLGTTVDYLCGDSDQKEKQPTLASELSPEEKNWLLAMRDAPPVLRQAALSVLKSSEPSQPVPGESASAK